jgi:hypothetical protein
LVVTLAIGCLIGMLIMVPSVWKRGRLAAGLKKRIRHIEKEAAGAAKSVEATKSETSAPDAEAAAQSEADKAAKKG